MGATRTHRSHSRNIFQYINLRLKLPLMVATGPGGSLPRVAVLLLLALSGAQAQRAWFKQLPPNNYYEPDIDVTSPTALPRIPISPYHMQVSSLGGSVGRWGLIVP